MKNEERNDQEQNGNYGYWDKKNWLTRAVNYPLLVSWKALYRYRFTDHSKCSISTLHYFQQTTHITIHDLLLIL